MVKIKYSRAASFVVIFLVYAAAFVFGTWVYSLFDLDWWLRLLIADAAATAFTFAFSVVL